MAETEPTHGACCPVVNTLDIIGGVEGIDFILFTRGNPTIQRITASAGGRYPADVDVAAARVGVRRYCPSRSVSAGAAEGGVFVDRVRTDIDARHRGDTAGVSNMPQNV